MSLKDKAAEAQRTRELVEVDLELERTRSKVATLQRQLLSSQAGQRDLELRLASAEAVAKLRSDDQGQPAWLTPRKVEGDNQGVIYTALSDMHLGEVVRPSEVDYLNAYNVEIADARLERYFNGIEYLSRHQLTGTAVTGIVVGMLGDTVSGSIHDELTQTNELTVMQTVVRYVPRIAAGLRFLADQFDVPVHVAVVPGNHGRNTRKPRAKLRSLDNADWLIGQLLAAQFAEDDRLTFDVPDGTDALVTMYDTTILLTHGDQTTGGGGIGGIWPPIKRLEARKAQRYAAQGKTFDWISIGHWHQYLTAGGLMVNGSTKGWDEYAAVMNFHPERAQQSFAMVTPENGVTWTAPVFCDDPKSEGWGRKRRG